VGADGEAQGGGGSGGGRGMHSPVAERCGAYEEVVRADGEVWGGGGRGTQRGEACGVGRCRVG
jgi:hypothetical protein